MKISNIIIGILEENCYLIEKNNQYLLVDPGEDLNEILKFIKNKNIIGILITHHHHDHVASLPYLKKQFPYPIYDYNNVKEGNLKIGPFEITIIFTPGHTKDSICFYFPKDKIMLTGDFLFKNTIGRWDLEGGDKKEIFESIAKIKKYSDDITIYPGHGDITNLGREKIENPYF